MEELEKIFNELFGNSTQKTIERKFLVYSATVASDAVILLRAIYLKMFFLSNKLSFFVAERSIERNCWICASLTKTFA